MIILDTNVVSGLMQRVPDAALVRWLDRQPVPSLWLTSITVMEVRFGIELLARGRRRGQIADAFRRLQDEMLEGRILPFDRSTAEKAGEFAAIRRAAGRPVEFRDVEIAGIAALHGATVATRNIRDFEGWIVEVTDPWKAIV